MESISPPLIFFSIISFNCYRVPLKVLHRGSSITAHNCFSNTIGYLICLTVKTCVTHTLRCCSYLINDRLAKSSNKKKKTFTRKNLTNALDH